MEEIIKSMIERGFSPQEIMEDIGKWRDVYDREDGYCALIWHLIERIETIKQQ